MRILSLRQPWAWLAVHGGMDIAKIERYLHYRGPILIHAARGMTSADYNSALALAKKADPGGVVLPHPREYVFGGVIGWGRVYDSVYISKSPWFTEKNWWLVLREVQPLPFTQVRAEIDVNVVDDEWLDAQAWVGPLREAELEVKGRLA